ncbi:MAG: tetratricopeptide repeat protein [Bacteroidetes bacterium]|nr:tetratricopeptide repeat protein [Bacteroidota bacterium]
MRVSIALALVIVCLHITAIAQTLPNVDSLIAELPKAKQDTNKFNLLQEISNIYFKQNPDLGIKYGKEALDLATEIHYEYGCMKGNNLMARCYAVQNKLPEALKYFNAALAVARNMKNPRFEAILLSSISAVYATNSDYDKALQYAMQAKAVNEKAGIKYMVNLMTNIGYLYVTQNKHKEALPYYEEGIRQALDPGSESDSSVIADLYLNRGTVYFAVGDYVAALQDFVNAGEILNKLQQTRTLGMAYANMGETYSQIAAGKSKVALPDSLRDKNACLLKAEQYLNKARAIAEELHSIYIRSEVYNSLSGIYVQMNKYPEAYRYLKLSHEMKDSLQNIDKEKEFARMEAQLLVKKQTDSLNYLNAIKDKEIAKRKVERNGAIALISLVGIISLLLINRQKLKHQQRRKEAEAETQRISELAKQQLDDFTRSIQEKNDLIEKFTTEIEKYQALPCSNELPEKESSLLLLQNSVILTEDQWVDFQSLFDKVHSGYINRAKGKYPELTAAELRFFVLTKLGLSNKEMAAMLGVSMEAVRVSKHRLLKKIQLPDGISLEETVQAV